MRSKSLFKILIAKKISQRRDVNTNISKKDAALFAKYTWVDINAPIRSSKFAMNQKR